MQTTHFSLYPPAMMQRNQSAHTACTYPASSNRKGERFVNMPSAKKERKHSITSRVSPLHLFCATAACCCFTTERSFEASLFVNFTPLILKGGDSRLKLLSFEIFVVLGQIGANFHYFTFWEIKHIRRWSKKYSASVFNFWLVHSFWKPTTGVKFCAEGVWQNILGW